MVEITQYALKGQKLIALGKELLGFQPVLYHIWIFCFLYKTIRIAPNELNLKITIFPYVSSLISNFYMNMEHFKQKRPWLQNATKVFGDDIFNLLKSR